MTIILNILKKKMLMNLRNINPQFNKKYKK